MRTLTRSTLQGLAFAAVAAAAPLSACAQTPPSPDQAQQIARYLETTRARLNYPVREEAVERAAHEVGRRADGSPIVIDLTLPKGCAGKRVPVAILLHGGLPDEAPIRPRAWRAYQDWGAALAQNGVAAVMFDHSLGVPRRRLDQALGEIDAVLAWIAREGPKRCLDAERVSALAFSAGGLLMPELLAESRPLKLRRAVMFYPSTGVAPGSPSAAVVEPALAERMDLSAAAQRLSRGGAQILVLRAGGDEIPGLLPMLDRSVQALLAADARVEVINLPAAPHGFDYLTKDKDTLAAVERALAFAARP